LPGISQFHCRDNICAARADYLFGRHAGSAEASAHACGRLRGSPPQPDPHSRRPRTAHPKHRLRIPLKARSLRGTGLSSNG
jgi:hypothetical protein